MDPRQGELRGDAAAAAGARAQYPDDASADQIRQDIRRTRAEMDNTVDALGERLKPRHLLDDLIDWWQGGTGTRQADVKDNVKEFGARVVETVKDHPMPALLVGAGVVWAMFDSGRSRSGRGGRAPGNWRDLREYSGSVVDARTGQPYDESYGASYGGAGGASGTTGGTGSTGGAFGAGTSSGGAPQGGPGMIDKAKGAASSAAHAVSGAASSAAGTVGDAASSAADTVRDWAGSARDTGAHLADQARDAASTAGDYARRGYDYSRRTLSDAMDEYPLAVGAAAMAAGLIAGLIIPGTRREDELMGETSDSLKRAAVDMGSEAVERGQQVVSATAGAVMDEADRQGLNPDNLGDKIRHVAKDVRDAARESAKREGLDDLGQKARSIAETATHTAKDEAHRHKDEMGYGEGNG